MMVLNIGLAVLFAAFRVYGDRSPVFQALVHLYMGGLAASWYHGRERFKLDLFVGLCVLELVCFALSRSL